MADNNAIYGGSQYRALVFLFTAAISIAYQSEAPWTSTIEETVTLEAPQDDVFALATSTEWLQVLLPLVDEVTSVGHSEMSVEKYYHSRYSSPIFGEVLNALKVTEYKRAEIMRLSGTTSWLQPELVIAVNKFAKSRTQLKVTVASLRTSVLFQHTVAPVLKLWHLRRVRSALQALKAQLKTAR